MNIGFHRSDTMKGPASEDAMKTLPNRFPNRFAPGRPEWELSDLWQVPKDDQRNRRQKERKAKKGHSALLIGNCGLESTLRPHGRPREVAEQQLSQSSCPHFPVCR